MAKAEAEILVFRDPINVVIMNASGPSDGEGSGKKRRKLIANVLKSRKPDLVLFQEFKWQGIKGRAWKDTPLPSHYVYTGNTEASIMYDSRRLQLTTLPQTNLQAPLDELKRKVDVSQDFAPLARSSIRLLKTNEPDGFKVLVVSWHGVHRITEKEKKKQFQYLQVYLRDLSEREDAAVLVGGDFNIEMSLIEGLVLPEIILYNYRPSERREGRKIDYFMASPALTLTDVEYIDLIQLNDASDNQVNNPENLFDHDPICTTVTRRRLTRRRLIGRMAIFLNVVCRICKIYLICTTVTRGMVIILNVVYRICNTFFSLLTELKGKWLYPRPAVLQL